MPVYLRTKFHVSSVILTSFRQRVGNFTPSHLTSNDTPKNPTQIRVKTASFLKALF